MSEIMRTVFILCLICVISVIHAVEFNVTAEAHSGYETGVYDPADSLFNASPLVSVLAEPLVAFDINSQLRAQLSTEVCAAYRFSANSDFNAGPALRIVRERPQGSTEWGLSAGYYALAGSVDPDQPMDYWLYSFTAASVKKQKDPFKLSYSLTVLDGSAEARTDIKNKLKVKKTFKIATAFSPSLGTGIGLNLSNIEGYSYGEVDAVFSSYSIFHEQHMFMTMLYFTYRTFGSQETENGARVIKNTKKSGQSPASTNLLSTRIVTVFIIYTYELSKKLDIEVEYSYRSSSSDFSTFEPSHQVLVGFLWRLREL
ncbi:MAG: hypothetical protein A2268_12240 [Candidatus Raymondbacteria bacterium RifOxyA12_full_50_37]|uniref:Uncharacterized protein n=1 Tax=Candidatus Raymondbacteria bacterium RIFOXYD12_FULL_49_13 TaxID=1817890 RepID=A0A1F7F2M2_UNCRA|nr:MAG: hypothetical protein A2268_12240 [Candidatus Raymondbacteria bacterium RifOxyA12_full_50_37]OGJ90311.1 MAG: hypothetical protein A2248_00125 [Candidatus Raymondbacteria bacterium RIFOXYA2_FULL_49_16]OGJ97301.1 MAG: hypothetical protein A2453_01585 [Candidatus Raymondbacteria bacterium RIFOXYC2_FULL_50_21]OGK00914.1 MAG: hypothetical protein A2519_12755 [Candidatus Raymondbacteria bacterium RIFOXYD12_FULL_49_13]OGP43123.1 MAG: hypothetical protein A2324_19350 [Candidatus Raymondbacteria 